MFVLQCVPRRKNVFRDQVGGIQPCLRDGTNVKLVVDDQAPNTISLVAYGMGIQMGKPQPFLGRQTLKRHLSQLLRADP